VKIFWFDTETSGLDEKENGIISLAYKVEIDGNIEEEGELFSNCAEKLIEGSALAINGFTLAQMSAFPTASAMYQELINVFSRYINRYDKNDKLIAGGYNVQFDMRFLRQLWLDNGDKYFGSWFAYGVIDPSQVLRFLEYAKGSANIGGKLVDVAVHYGVDVENAHDAMADINMTIAVTKAMIDELSNL
jgi:DNA polymerase-3 subunit epsilon